MKRSKLSALILGENAERVGKVKTLLAPHCDTLCSASSVPTYKPSSRQPVYHVVVVTGPLADQRPSNFFRQLKKHYPGARIIYIGDAIDANTEIEARTAGTLFVGSVDAFNANVAPIARSALKKQREDS